MVTISRWKINPLVSVAVQPPEVAKLLNVAWLVVRISQFLTNLAWAAWQKRAGNIVSPPTLLINFTQLTYYPHDENGTVYSTAVAHETRRRQLAAQDKQTPCPTSTGTHQ